MFFDPCWLASAVNDRLDVNGVTQNRYRRVQMETLRKRLVIIPIHNTMSATVDPQQFYICRQALLRIRPETWAAAGTSPRYFVYRFCFVFSPRAHQAGDVIHRKGRYNRG